MGGPLQTSSCLEEEQTGWRRVGWSRKTKSGPCVWKGWKGKGQFILSLLLFSGGLAYLSFLLAPSTHLSEYELGLRGYF